MSNQITSASSAEFSEEDLKYLEQNVFPHVLPAMENLLREIERLGTPIWMFAHLNCEESATAINPIVWLAQYIMRHNPKYQRKWVRQYAAGLFFISGVVCVLALHWAMMWDLRFIRLTCIPYISTSTIWHFDGQPCTKHSLLLLFLLFPFFLLVICTHRENVNRCLHVGRPNAWWCLRRTGQLRHRREGRHIGNRLHGNHRLFQKSVFNSKQSAVSTFGSVGLFSSVIYGCGITGDCSCWRWVLVCANRWISVATHAGRCCAFSAGVFLTDIISSLIRHNTTFHHKQRTRVFGWKLQEMQSINKWLDVWSLWEGQQLRFVYSILVYIHQLNRETSGK